MQKSLKTMLAVGAVAIATTSEARVTNSQTPHPDDHKAPHSTASAPVNHRNADDAKPAANANASFKSSLLTRSADSDSGPKNVVSHTNSNKEWQGA